MSGPSSHVFSRSLSLAALAVLALAVAGCDSGTSGNGGDGSTGIDAPADCRAACITSLSSPCECMLPCRGQLTVATCTTSECQCTVDGTPTYSYPYAGCDVNRFFDGCMGRLPDAGVDAATLSDDAGTDAALAPPTYTTETRTISSSAVSRTFLLARPTDAASRPGMPLFFALHGDGGSGASMRSALPLESFAPAGGAVYVYPDAPGGAFEYWTYDGRTREAQFVTDVIAALETELGIDTGHVFVAGFSGGATMANALGCRLGPSVIRGLGLHSGTLYSTDGPSGPEFTYTGSGGVSCALPAAIFIWGESDTTSGVSFAEGQGVRDNYLATASCAATTSADAPIAPCVTYDACTHGVAWCPIPGMAHAIWPNAAEAMTDFFSTLP